MISAYIFIITGPVSPNAGRDSSLIKQDTNTVIRLPSNVREILTLGVKTVFHCARVNFHCFAVSDI